MTSETKSSTDLLFTLESANRTLPLVSVIVRDLTAMYAAVVERRGRLDSLKSERPEETDASDLYAQELKQIEEELDRDGRELERYLTELDDLGVAARNSIQGAVGFPAMLDGRLVELSWKLGESEIGHFHEVGANPDDRQPLSQVGQGA